MTCKISLANDTVLIWENIGPNYFDFQYSLRALLSLGLFTWTNPDSEVVELAPIVQQSLLLLIVNGVYKITKSFTDPRFIQVEIVFYHPVQAYRLVVPKSWFRSRVNVLQFSKNVLEIHRIRPHKEQMIKIPEKIIHDKPEFYNVSDKVFIPSRHYVKSSKNTMHLYPHQDHYRIEGYIEFLQWNSDWIKYFVQKQSHLIAHISSSSLKLQSDLFLIHFEGPKSYYMTCFLNIEKQRVTIEHDRTWAHPVHIHRTPDILDTDLCVSVKEPKPVQFLFLNLFKDCIVHLHTQ